jgi:plastocyanin
MRAAIVSLLLLAPLAGCGGGDDEESAGGTAGDAQVVEVRETEFALQPATVTVDAGRYTFRAINDGSAPHALEIDGNGIEEETDEIGPGERAEVTVELAAGEYELYCPVGNHREQGMEGRLVVGGGGAGAATTEGEDEASGDGYG